VARRGSTLSRYAAPLIAITHQGDPSL